MNRTITRLLCCFMLVGSMLAGMAATPTKIGTVDLKRLFENYWKTKQANGSLKDLTADMNKEKAALGEKHKKASEDYKKLLEDANDQAVSAAEREKRKKGAEDKMLEIRQIELAAEQFVRNANASLSEQERRMRDNIVKELRDNVAARARAGGFTLVIDTSGETANNAPTVLFATTENDMTDAILADLNANVPAAAAAPATAVQPAPEKKAPVAPAPVEKKKK